MATKTTTPAEITDAPEINDAPVTPDAPEVTDGPETPAENEVKDPETPALSPEAAALAEAFALLKADPEAFKAKYPELAAFAPPARAYTVKDWQREVDLALVGYVPSLIAGIVPEAHRPKVTQLVVNQLHHLVRPDSGLWPADLVKPDRSEWR